MYYNKINHINIKAHAHSTLLLLYRSPNKFPIGMPHYRSLRLSSTHQTHNDCYNMRDFRIIIIIARYLKIFKNDNNNIIVVRPCDYIRDRAESQYFSLFNIIIVVAVRVYYVLCALMSPADSVACDF